jgi:SurA-like N-terminal domain
MRITTATLALLMLYLPCRAAHSELDYVAAVVNGDAISFSQVRAQSAPEVARFRDTLKGEALLGAIKAVRASALNRLIDREVFLQEFQRLGVSLLADWTDEQKKAASRGRFDGDRQEWLDRLKDKAHIRTFGTLLEDCRDLESTRKDELVSRWSGLPLPQNAHLVLTASPF